MKFATLWKLGAVTAMLTTLVGVDVAWSGNCYDALVGQTYRCKYKYEPAVGGEFTDTCATFYPADVPRQKMGLNWSDQYECTCTAKGSYASPQFNQGKEFLCSSVYPDTLHDAFSGKVVGKKIKGLYNNYSNGASAVVECVKDPTCP
ncbi:MAG: hypothetical protein HYZ50_04730 [Deltaproteobacteria bacterium]|nr:hypothetical protein [Deltaproteobacteria bacterium]